MWPNGGKGLLQCLDTAGWAPGRTSEVKKLPVQPSPKIHGNFLGKTPTVTKTIACCMSYLLLGRQQVLVPAHHATAATDAQDVAQNSLPSCHPTTTTHNNTQHTQYKRDKVQYQNKSKHPG